MKLFLSFLFLFLLSFTQLPAQDKLPDREMFMVHEDVVFPYMSDKYEKAAKNFVEMLNEANVEGSYRAFQTEYFTYSTIISVKDFEGLAKYIENRSEMMEKISEEKMENVMSQFDGCYASHRNYLITLRNDLSYKPVYGLNEDDGLNFRHFDYINVIPGKEDEMNDILKEYKSLYESKGIEEGYRVYFGGIGTDMPYIIFVQPAKGRVDWATLSDRQDEQLGEEGGKLLNRMMAITQKFEHKDGMMRPDLYYSQKK
jgi:hypothetical protein